MNLRRRCKCRFSNKRTENYTSLDAYVHPGKNLISRKTSFFFNQTTFKSEFSNEAQTMFEQRKSGCLSLKASLLSGTSCHPLVYSLMEEEWCSNVSDGGQPPPPPDYGPQWSPDSRKRNFFQHRHRLSYSFF